MDLEKQNDRLGTELVQQGIQWRAFVNSVFNTAECL